MKTIEQAELKLEIGERYLYRVETYEIIAINGSRIQLRSVRNRKNIAFKEFARLVLAHKRGEFKKVQEAPLAATVNKIISALSKKSRDELDKRLMYVQSAISRFGYRLPRKKTMLLIKELAETHDDASPPCYTTLYNWLRTYLLAGESPIALIRARSKTKHYRVHRQPIEIQDLIDYHVDILYLSRTYTSVTEVIEAIQFSIEELNIKRPVSAQLSIPSESTLRRIINELDTFEVEKAQIGKRAATKNQRWSIKTSRPRHLLERAECDTHVLDIIVVNRHGDVLGKAYLTIILEIASRRVIGWDISLNPESAEKNLRALKNSLSSDGARNGLAAIYIMDNGKGYTADKIRDFIHLLGSIVIYCEPHEPNQKPHVETWFKTLTKGIIQHCQGTTFSNINERGDYASEKEAIFTIDQLRALFEDWLENVYHQSLHRALNTSPNTYWDSNIDPIFPPKKISNEDLKRYLLSTTTVTPSNGRVTFKYLQWTGPSIAYLSTLSNASGSNPRKSKHKLVLHYDVSELGKAWVTHPDFPDDIYEVEAVDSEYQTGLTMHMHKLVREALTRQKQFFNFREARDNRVRINLALAEAKDKRSRRKQALLEEFTRPQTPRPPGRLAKPNEISPSVDPRKYISESTAPQIDQTMEMPDDYNS